MAWTRQPLIVTALKDLLALKVRAERIALVQNLHRIEAQVQASGASPEQLAKLRELRSRVQALPVPEKS